MGFGNARVPYSTLLTVQRRAETAEAALDALRVELAEVRAERDLLQDVLDSRPAINAGLPESYARWSQGVMSGDVYRTAHGACASGDKPS